MNVVNDQFITKLESARNWFEPRYNSAPVETEIQCLAFWYNGIDSTISQIVLCIESFACYPCWTGEINKRTHSLWDEGLPIEVGETIRFVNTLYLNVGIERILWRNTASKCGTGENIVVHSDYGGVPSVSSRFAYVYLLQLTL